MSPDKQRRTFISYSRINKDFALELAKELKLEGFDVWLDQLDIPLGARWDREVEKALKESEIFLIILTSASVASENVLDEIGYAIDSGKRILPILLEECEIPLRLRRFQYVDFTNKSFSDGVESAKGLLRGLIAQPTTPRSGGVVGQQAQTEAERRAKAEATRKAKEETERKAKEEAQRLIAQKSEADRKAKEDAERKEKEETQRLAAQKDEANRKLKEKADVDRIVPKEPQAESQRQEIEPEKAPNKLGLVPVVIGVIMATFIIVFFWIKPGKPSSPTPLPDTPTPAETEAVPTTVAPTATHPVATLSPQINDAQDVPMVLVPAGTFTMGSDSETVLAACKALGVPGCRLEDYQDESPPHKVYLDDYYIDQFEVTNARYAACVHAGMCEKPKVDSSKYQSNYYNNSKYDNYPVLFVNWEMAMAYCDWREARLPTEAEWEKAARGTDARTYPWGERIDCTYANFLGAPGGCAGDNIIAVGSYESGNSPYGAYDMAGNIIEWVADWYDKEYYTTLPVDVTNPTGPDTGSQRVMRGGAWDFSALGVRSANRDSRNPNAAGYSGFRCARSVSQSFPGNPQR